MGRRRSLLGLVLGVFALVMSGMPAVSASVRSGGSIGSIGSVGFVGFAADDGARIVDRARVDAQTWDLTVWSPAIDRRWKVRVRLPRGWSADPGGPGRTYPTVYAWGGAGGDDQASWERRTDIVRLAAGYDAILVEPAADAPGGFTNWYNGGKYGTPAWETFHTSELPQLVERNYRGGSSRAVIGISAGAQGALVYAAHHPGLYKFAAAYSGILHTTTNGMPLVLRALNTAPGVNADRIWGVPGVDTEQWARNDPYVLAPALRGVSLYVSSGTTGRPGPLDERSGNLGKILGWQLVAGTTETATGATSADFVRQARRLGLALTANLYGDGWHAWPYWSRELRRSWPLLVAAIGARRI